jgi:DNA polymerase III sliding clamp (beta) subunit (PCNA family)
MISSSKDGVSFSGKSDVGGAVVQLGRDSAEILELDVKQDATGKYSLKYLLDISKAIGSASDALVIEYSTSKPVKLEFKLNEQGARIDQFLAPRVSSD